MSDWNRQFNIALGGFNGLSLCDLEDDDIAEIESMRDSGFSPEEAFDVYMEVEGVE